MTIPLRLLRKISPGRYPQRQCQAPRGVCLCCINFFCLCYWKPVLEIKNLQEDIEIFCIPIHFRLAETSVLNIWSNTVYYFPISNNSLCYEPRSRTSTEEAEV